MILRHNISVISYYLSRELCIKTFNDIIEK